MVCLFLFCFRTNDDLYPYHYHSRSEGDALEDKYKLKLIARLHFAESMEFWILYTPLNEKITVVRETTIVVLETTIGRYHPVTSVRSNKCQVLGV